jgi:hypothetical protein
MNLRLRKLSSLFLAMVIFAGTSGCKLGHDLFKSEATSQDKSIFGTDADSFMFNSCRISETTPPPSLRIPESLIRFGNSNDGILNDEHKLAIARELIDALATLPEQVVPAFIEIGGSIHIDPYLWAHPTTGNHGICKESMNSGQLVGEKPVGEIITNRDVAFCIIPQTSQSDLKIVLNPNISTVDGKLSAPGVHRIVEAMGHVVVGTLMYRSFTQKPGMAGQDWQVDLREEPTNEQKNLVDRMMNALDVSLAPSDSHYRDPKLIASFAEYFAAYYCNDKTRSALQKKWPEYTAEFSAEIEKVALVSMNFETIPPVAIASQQDEQQSGGFSLRTTICGPLTPDIVMIAFKCYDQDEEPVKVVKTRTSAGRASTCYRQGRRSLCDYDEVVVVPRRTYRDVPVEKGTIVYSQKGKGFSDPAQIPFVEQTVCVPMSQIVSQIVVDPVGGDLNCYSKDGGVAGGIQGEIKVQEQTRKKEDEKKEAERREAERRAAAEAAKKEATPEQPASEGGKKKKGCGSIESKADSYEFLLLLILLPLLAPVVVATRKNESPYLE